MTTQRPWRNRNKQAQWRSMDQFSLSPPSFSSVMILHAWFSTIERHRLVKLTWNIHQTSLPLRWQWMGPSCHSLDLANHSHTHTDTETLLLTINLKQDSHMFKTNLNACMHKNVHTKTNNLKMWYTTNSYFTSHIFWVSPQIYYFISNVVLRKK